MAGRISRRVAPLPWRGGSPEGRDGVVARRFRDLILTGTSIFKALKGRQKNHRKKYSRNHSRNGRRQNKFVIARSDVSALRKNRNGFVVIRKMSCRFSASQMKIIKPFVKSN
jgi:hypothetical protein